MITGGIISLKMYLFTIELIFMIAVVLSLPRTGVAMIVELHVVELEIFALEGQ